MNNDKELYGQLVEVMENIAVKTLEKIYTDYFDQLGNEKKYLLELCAESYKSVLVTCFSLRNVFVSQTATILRTLLESVSTINLLTEHPDLLCEYIKHCKIRIKIGNEPDNEKNILEKEFPNVEKNKRLSFMDYGWFKSKIEPKDGKNFCPDPSVSQLIELAGFDDIIQWKKQYLDKFSHQSYTTANMINNNGMIEIFEVFVKIISKLFDYLCYDFHNITGFDFIVDNEDLFRDRFRSIYESIMD